MNDDKVDNERERAIHIRVNGGSIFLKPSLIRQEMCERAIHTPINGGIISDLTWNTPDFP